MLKSQFTLMIGIDPGTKTGIAVWDRKKKEFRSILTVPIHRAMSLINGLHILHPGELYVRFEDARNRKFFKGENMAAKQQGAGSIKRDCQIWHDFLTDNAIIFDNPTAGRIKSKMNKTDFEKLTGWKQMTSNHARDAAMLVFGF